MLPPHGTSAPGPLRDPTDRAAAHAQVLAALPEAQRTRPGELALAGLLADFLAAPDLHGRLDAFLALYEWISAGAAEAGGAGANARLEAALGLLEANGELQRQFHRGVREILRETRSVELFAEAGLRPRASLWSEARRRIIERLLPSARADSDLAKLVFRMCHTPEAVGRLLAIDTPTCMRIARVLFPANDGEAWSRQREDLVQALYLLSVHVAGLGLSPGMRARSRPVPIEESPFYRLQLATRELVEKDGAPAALAAWRAIAAHSRAELACVHQRMEDAGVSTSLVFDMGTIERAIVRMERIAEVLSVAVPARLVIAVKSLIDDVITARREDMSLGALFRANSDLIARKVVERSGKSAEHYIANNRDEYRTLWRASLGGGLLTVLTAAIKLRIGEGHLPPFVAAMAAGTNYAASFILLQHLHLALATKQPSVTAAAFARIVRETRGQARLERVTEFVRRIIRSQLASAFGNVLAVCLGSILFAQLWVLLFGHAYLEPRSAAYVYATLNPLASGTVIYATLTGVILWVSALAGGWCDNIAAFYHLPAAIAQHPLSRRLGRERMQRLAGFVDANLSGWTTSIVLGYLLAFTPAIGAFLGIPLDVRHVTLSSGTLALAASSFGRDWLNRGWFVHSVIGIATIFVLNLGVSFAIAARVAFKAYGVPRRDQLRLVRYAFASFLREPLRFLLPPRKDENEET